ncbi:DUF6286 domain-containing protein [Streptomonospora nanhaiensis]|uniref:DUF6286 domain-containing protein n=1 Tax=Streptomonospora nanhaiensis TaxID=1323731 RepID=A0A853BRH7_9ACTN|nr:DUF6286 domain-containing protein [Streptomonospora nanhaiensis]MBV2362652.1 alkaline shock response membrane anchor protein AmaP [Streptomonospora nanhaiensis]MBX9387288.1 alkaline shock response membrane anchor protein AmaP [Streptomonospora nanhaiensis]NYI97998.1 hypothetical protein [Streptomonospora nanhaiensis]
MTTVEDALMRPDPATARRARRVAVHTFRPRRSWPALIVGALVLLVAALAAAEVVSALVGSPMRTAVTTTAEEYAVGAQWGDPAVQAASLLLALIGLALIAIALLPGRGRFAPLRTDDPDLVVGLSRPALRRTLVLAAQSVGGVRAARVTVGRHRIGVRVHTDLIEAPELRGQVAAAVERRLTEIAPLGDFKVITHVRCAKA